MHQPSISTCLNLLRAVSVLYSSVARVDSWYNSSQIHAITKIRIITRETSTVNDAHKVDQYFRIFPQKWKGVTIKTLKLNFTLKIVVINKPNCFDKPLCYVSPDNSGLGSPNSS